MDSKRKSEVLVGIALCSNSGDRFAELDAAIAYLRSLSIDGEIREASRVGSEPVDCPPGTPPFLNTVAEIRVDPALLTPHKLRQKLQDFEISRGRVPEIHAPRPIDLDLIYYGTLKLEEADLVLPHPKARFRPFVAGPLSDLRPDMILPGHGVSPLLSRRHLAVGLILVVGIALLAWVGNGLGSLLHVAKARDRLNEYLESCPPQQVRISVVFTGPNGDQLVNVENTIDFVAANITHAGHVEFVHPLHSYLVRYMPPQYVNFSDPSFLRGDQPERIKWYLGLMTPPSDSTLEPFRDRFHIAFWKDNHLCVYHFSREETAKVQAVLRAAQLDVVLELWNDRTQNAPSGDN
jgi:2-amino-4-hydroxy-6-hydroxymethyldihydropteridine diphosphokinase